MNIKEIAEKAGVSTATVSRVVNNRDGVKPELRERIKAIIEENDYKPNEIARGLVNKKSKLVGIMFPQINPYYSMRMESILSELKKEGYGAIIVTAVGCFEGETENFSTLIERQVDGILYFAAKVKEAHKEALAKAVARAPVVVVDREIEESNSPCVVQDDYGGAVKVMKHLIETGNRRIAFIKGSSYEKCADFRFKAYCDILAENGIEYSEGLVFKGDLSLESGYVEAAKIVEMAERPTAIFAANDNMAIGAMRYFDEVGLRIPDEIAVAGFDDIEVSRYVNPPLTTIRQNYAGTGITAVKMLVDMIKTGEVLTKKIVMNQELVIRESTIRR